MTTAAAKAATVTTSPLIVDGVSAGYGDTQVLWDVSLRVEPGEIVALIGSNGAASRPCWARSAAWSRPGTAACATATWR